MLLELLDSFGLTSSNFPIGVLRTGARYWQLSREFTPPVPKFGWISR